MNNKILDAALWAAELHKNQRRKGKAQEPYINHLLEVAKLVDVAGGSDDAVIAALLHDAIEDQKIDPSAIEGGFGFDVRRLVEEVTDDKSLPKATRKQLQITTARHKSCEAKLIKLADKISNMRSIINSPPADWSQERCNDYIHWAIQVANELRGNSAWLDDLFQHTAQKAMRCSYHG